MNLPLREVVHGFRSTFRDWAAEQTSFPSEIDEAALAHAKGDKTEASYQRGDFFDKRRKLTDAWARYCAVTAERLEPAISRSTQSGIVAREPRANAAKGAGPGERAGHGGIRSKHVGA